MQNEIGRKTERRWGVRERGKDRERAREGVMVGGDGGDGGDGQSDTTIEVLLCD